MMMEDYMKNMITDKNLHSKPKMKEKKRAFQLRSIIIHAIAHMKNTQYLSDIQQIASSYYCKERFHNKKKKDKADFKDPGG